MDKIKKQFVPNPMIGEKDKTRMSINRGIGDEVKSAYGSDANADLISASEVKHIQSGINAQTTFKLQK